MRTSIAISIAGLLLLSACSGNIRPDYKEVVVEDQFRLDIPETMQATNELHDFANLQVADEKEGFFLIGIAEPKEDLENLQLFYSIEDYADFVQRTVGGGLDTFNVATQHNQVINGFNCLSADLFGAISTEDEASLEVYYRVIILESPRYFYQLIGWTSRDNFRNFRSVANHIECSFVEMEASQPESPGAIDAADSPEAPGIAAEANPS